MFTAGNMGSIMEVWFFWVGGSFSFGKKWGEWLESIPAVNRNQGVDFLILPETNSSHLPGSEKKKKKEVVQSRLRTIHFQGRFAVSFREVYVIDV